MASTKTLHARCVLQNTHCSSYCALNDNTGVHALTAFLLSSLLFKVCFDCFQVAIQLSEKDVIRAHARDELGIDMDDLSNPWKAASASAVAFVFGAGSRDPSHLCV